MLLTKDEKAQPITAVTVAQLQISGKTDKNDLF